MLWFHSCWPFLVSCYVSCVLLFWHLCVSLQLLNLARKERMWSFLAVSICWCLLHNLYTPGTRCLQKGKKKLLHKQHFQDEITKRNQPTIQNVVFFKSKNSYKPLLELVVAFHLPKASNPPDSWIIDKITPAARLSPWNSGRSKIMRLKNTRSTQKPMEKPGVFMVFIPQTRFLMVWGGFW